MKSAFPRRNRRLADFDHPLEMLMACHERITMQCETLARLAGHLPVHGCDAQAQQAASNVMRYFDSAGRHHHEDEELDLLPRMLAAARGQNAERVALLAARIRQDHAEMARLWEILREPLENIAHGGDAMLDTDAVDRFCTAYRAHMALEEENLIPLAESLLAAVDLAALGKDMAARRGVE
ncbi:MAG: hemerythrin domain-containing protein [Burkholderiales bacterium]|nr:hemerythrin domain-containing protein [Burkholderiales bacterium]